MEYAQILREYRIFCTECGSSIDVKAVNAGDDAMREAQKKGWYDYDERGVLCPLCLDLDRRENVRKLKKIKDEGLL